MSQYKRRNRPNENFAGKTAQMEEQELVLRLKKEELFDSHIILPHSEVNTAVYDAVNHFVQQYSGKTMLLTIMTDSITEQVQNVFKEAYQSHYEDEYRKINGYLNRRIVRAVLLLVISAAAFFSSTLLARNTNFPDYIITILGQAAIFCLWEIGYTHFSRREAAEERNRIVRARDAVIEFHCRALPAEK